jgi:hypothetical protein
MPGGDLQKSALFSFGDVSPDRASRTTIRCANCWPWLMPPWRGCCVALTALYKWVGHASIVPGKLLRPLLLHMLHVVRSERLHPARRSLVGRHVASDGLRRG